jgi:hypothetical protein
MAVEIVPHDQLLDSYSSLNIPQCGKVCMCEICKINDIQSIINIYGCSEYSAFLFSHKLLKYLHEQNFYEDIYLPAKKCRNYIAHQEMNKNIRLSIIPSIFFTDNAIEDHHSNGGSSHVLDEYISESGDIIDLPVILSIITPIGTKQIYEYKNKQYYKLSELYNLVQENDNFEFVSSIENIDDIISPPNILDDEYSDDDDEYSDDDDDDEYSDDEPEEIIETKIIDRKKGDGTYYKSVEPPYKVIEMPQYSSKYSFLEDIDYFAP